MPKLWTVFTDSSGQQFSFARVCSGIALLFILGWACIVVYFKHDMPELTGAGIFWGILYGVNRAGESYDKTVQTNAATASGSKTPTPSPPPPAS